MGDITYQVYFINDDGDREYIGENFFTEKKAITEMNKLEQKGYDGVGYESIDVEVGDCY